VDGLLISKKKVMLPDEVKNIKKKYGLSLMMFHMFHDSLLETSILASIDK